MTPDKGRHLAFPFHVGENGSTAQTSTLEEHVPQELIQLILTNLGERVFLPEFGGGVRRLIFENVDEPTAGLTKTILTQAISRWLGDRINLENLSVRTEDGTLEVDLSYRILGTEETRIMRFQKGAV